MANYKKLFESIEKSLLTEGSKALPIEQIQERLEIFKHFETREFSDSDYYQILVNVVFYSGFKAATVTSKLETIHKHLGIFEAVADYEGKDIERILADENMIRHSGKIKACIKNAQTFRDLARKYGSFQNYIEKFNGKESEEGFVQLKEELKSRFSWLGKVTVYHFLMDIGFQVLKPDRVICRIFERLGLIENRKQINQAILQGRKFAQSANHPIRYIDIVFVAYGQDKSIEFGIKNGICSEINPSCYLCQAKNLCNYYSTQSV